MRKENAASKRIAEKNNWIFVGTTFTPEAAIMEDELRNCSSWKPPPTEQDIKFMKEVLENGRDGFYMYVLKKNFLSLPVNYTNKYFCLEDAL